MSRSSEEVLLVIKHVRHKKSEGTLYMMGERMAWMLESRNVFSISHLYADIKTQKISPDTKDKVQLQVVMHDGSASTFQFANQKGRPAQQADRDSVKELLQQLLPHFIRKVSNQLQKKNQLFLEDPDSWQLYKDLVVTQVMTPEDFWASRSSKSSKSTKNNSKQNTGVSPAFLADIKPQTDGANGLKYNLTADIIDSIFKTYPMVKKKHAECVPHSLSESEFWTRFFQSHYFHRDRININNKDIFSECAKRDEEVIQHEIDQKVTNPKMDLSEIKDTVLEDEYRGVTEDGRASTNISNQSLIRRFNHHSTMVLRASGNNGKLDVQDAKGAASNSTKVENGRLQKSSSKSTTGTLDEPPQKKARFNVTMDMEELNSDMQVTGTSLRLNQMDRYMQGPTPISASRYTSSEDVVRALNNVVAQMASWNSNGVRNVSGAQALSVLGELSPGGALMQGTTHQQLHGIVAEDIQTEMKNTYSALCELLRHFWSCFPVTNKELEDKVVKMRGTLDRFQNTKVYPLKEQLSQYHYAIDLTGHMEDMLTAAFNKFDLWQTRRLSRKT